MHRRSARSARSARSVSVVLVLGVLLLGALASCSSGSSTSAPELSDPSGTGRGLVTDYMTILRDADGEALAAFLADGFVVQRADGSTATRDEYLATPISVSAFEIGPDVLGVQVDDVLVVRWSVVADESTADGTFGTDEAPRLSTFVWNDGSWRLVSHANFNTIPQPAPTAS